MVIWKKNKDYSATPLRAKIVDTMKLLYREPQRLEVAKKLAQSFCFEYDNINLVKETNNWYVFALDMDEKSEHKAILVNSTLETKVGILYSSNGFHFTNFEISEWRGVLLAELLKYKEQYDISFEAIADEIAHNNNQEVAQHLAIYNIYPNIQEDAVQYADMLLHYAL